MSNWKYIERKRRQFIRKYNRVMQDAVVKSIDGVFDLFMYDYSAQFQVNIEPVKEALYNLYAEVGGEFAQNIAIKLKDLDPWEEYMYNWAVTMSGKKITSIAVTLDKELEKLVRQYITQGVENGLGTYEIAKLIRDNVPNDWGKAARWKSKRIAQTEVIGASNRASFDAARSFGYDMKKTWLVAPGGVNKTERHRLPGAIANMTVMINEKFLVDAGNGYEEMDCPGDDSASPGNVVNCKCAISFEVI
jgi:hypothetical protein